MDKQEKQFSIPIPEVNFRCLLPLSKRLIERSDVYEKLTGGRIAHPDLVIPHSILSLNRTLMYSGDIFLASHIITFAVLCFGVSPSTFIKGCLEKHWLMKSIIPFVPGTWKTLPTTSLSSCSTKFPMKIFWQSRLLGKAVCPLSNRYW